MNRKQRRAARNSGVGPAPGLAATRAPAANFAALFDAAVMHHHAGALSQAEHCYRQVLAALPGHAEAHSRLGAVLMRQGKTADAIVHIERGLAVKPDMFEAYGSLTQAYMWSGQPERAIEAACRALELRETPQTRTMFAQCVGFVRFTADDERYRKFVLRALVEAWVRPRELGAVAISLIKASRAVKDAIAVADAAWPARASASELFAEAGMAALARDELLCRLLECDPITDVGLERLLANVRSAMLDTATVQGEADESSLGFYYSLARQCFINEYVFSTTDEEAEQAQHL
ncbi:MAG: tetratricopeptide repeat protein, partial [Xanthobacteraceae bacterium]